MPKKSASFYIFFAYSAWMLGLLFIRELPDLSAPGFSYWEHIRTHVHLFPFTTTGGFVRLLLQPGNYLSWMPADAYLAACHHAIRNLGGNILLFIPLGFLLPRVFPGCKAWQRPCSAPPPSSSAWKFCNFLPCWATAISTI